MLKFSTSISFMFGEYPFLERFQAAADAGFGGVEIQFVEAEADAMAAAATSAGVDIVLLNVDMGDLLAGGPGLSAVPGRERAFAEAVAKGAELAEASGARFLHLGPSLVPQGESRERCIAAYIENVKAALRLPALDSGTVLPLLEPMNTVDMPTAVFTDYSEAAALLQQEFGDRVGLQFDIYHVEKGGASAAALWEDLLPQIWHVQFSDTPARSAPGTGELDFAALFRLIADSDYAGWTGAEYFPQGPTSDSLGWLTDVP